MNKEIIGYVQCTTLEMSNGAKTGNGEIGKIYKVEQDLGADYLLEGLTKTSWKARFKLVTKEAYDLQNKPKFEVGKWYKNDINQYTKFASLKQDVYIYGHEHIYGTPTVLNKAYVPTWLFTLKSNPVLLTDLSEIQQYLPDGHPDKIVKEFVLPEEWYVKVTEANKEFFTKLRGWVALNGYITSQRLGTKTWGLWLPNPYGKEITLEQFKKYVLKEVDWTKATKEELLAEAKRRYPVGCTVMFGAQFKVLGPFRVSSCNTVETKIERDSYYYGLNDYESGRWAEIIETPKPVDVKVEQPKELFSKEQLEVISKMIDDKIKMLE